MESEGSGDIDSLYTRLPALEYLRGPKGEAGNCTMMKGEPGRDGLNGTQGPQGTPVSTCIIKSPRDV